MTTENSSTVAGSPYAADVAAFKARGGVVTICPPMTFTEQATIPLREIIHREAQAGKARLLLGQARAAAKKAMMGAETRAGVLAAALAGKSKVEIAAAVGRSVTTVDVHLGALRKSGELPPAKCGGRLGRPARLKP